MDDVEIPRDAGNLLETGDFAGPGRTYSIVPGSTGDVTRQMSAKLSSTAGEWKGMGAVWGNADNLRLPVAAGEMPHSWDVPGVGDYVGNPSGVYGIVPGDIDHAITSQLTTDVKPAASSLDVGDIRMDGFRVPEVDTARAVAGGETYGVGTSKVNPSGQTPKVSDGGGDNFKLPTEQELNDAICEWARMEKQLAPSKTKIMDFNTATVVYDAKTGKYYYGMNKGIRLSGDTLERQLADIMPEVSLNEYILGNCAEIDAVNQA